MWWFNKNNLSLAWRRVVSRWARCCGHVFWESSLEIESRGWYHNTFTKALLLQDKIRALFVTSSLGFSVLASSNLWTALEIATELELELVLISELAEESSSPPLMWPRSCRRNQMSSSELVILDTGHIFASRERQSLLRWSRRKEEIALATADWY